MKYLYIAITLVLVGCAQPVIKPVYVTKTVYVEVPKVYLVKCGVDIPPSVKEYVTLSPKDKESMLVDYIDTLLYDLRICNEQIGSLSNWAKQQTNINK